MDWMLHKFFEMEKSLQYFIDQIFISSASIEFHVRKCKAEQIMWLSPMDSVDTKFLLW